jgi:hypothetical protein
MLEGCSRGAITALHAAYSPQLSGIEKELILREPVPGNARLPQRLCLYLSHWITPVLRPWITMSNVQGLSPNRGNAPGKVTVYLALTTKHGMPCPCDETSSPEPTEPPYRILLPALVFLSCVLLSLITIPLTPLLHLLNLSLPTLPGSKAEFYRFLRPPHILFCELVYETFFRQYLPPFPPATNVDVHYLPRFYHLGPINPDALPTLFDRKSDDDRLRAFEERHRLHAGMLNEHEELRWFIISCIALRYEMAKNTAAQHAEQPQPSRLQNLCDMSDPTWHTAKHYHEKHKELKENPQHPLYQIFALKHLLRKLERECGTGSCYTCFFNTESAESLKLKQVIRKSKQTLKEVTDSLHKRSFKTFTKQGQDKEQHSMAPTHTEIEIDPNLFKETHYTEDEKNKINGIIQQLRAQPNEARSAMMNGLNLSGGTVPFQGLEAALAKVTANAHT